MYIICSSVCRVYASYAAVYAVCECIIRSCVGSVCMYHMQLRPEADGCWQPITTEGPLSAYSSSSSSLFVYPYADIWQIPCVFFIEVLVAPASFSLLFASLWLWGPPAPLFAQVVSRCFDSKAVTRMTQGVNEPWRKAYLV